MRLPLIVGTSARENAWTRAADGDTDSLPALFLQNVGQSKKTEFVKRKLFAGGEKTIAFLEMKNYFHACDLQLRGLLTTQPTICTSTLILGPSPENRKQLR
jgi:hypothetical protein